MVTVRYGGTGGYELELEDRQDLVVVRSNRRGARHDLSPLRRQSRAANDQLEPLFGFPPAGVGVYAAPEGASEELATILNDDPELEFAGRGLRDQFGAPVVYTENLFVKFADGVDAGAVEQALGEVGLILKRPLSYTSNAYFVGAPAGTGRTVFDLADQLLARDDVALCHPELVREVDRRGAFAPQWHLHRTDIGGQDVDAHVDAASAWAATRGAGVVICVIDDGVDIDHEEFSSAGKIVAPRGLSFPRTDDPRPAEGDNHGTACAGVACAEGRFGASGVAPEARLMPLRLRSGLGSQEEADAFVWAADHGADVISCSWGPIDGRWWDPDDPVHDQFVPLPDSTRLAIDYAVEQGRGGRGCVITWAAGNGNESVDNDGYASYERVIAVAACNDSGTRSVYSDVGDALWCAFPSGDGEPSATPGIWTTDRTGMEGYNPGSLSLGDEPGNYTNSFSGTSSACPGAAGVAALVLSRDPELRWNEVKELLRDCCDRIDPEHGDYDARGHSRLYGFGRLNAATAVRLAGSAEVPTETYPVPQPVETFVRRSIWDLEAEQEWHPVTLAYAEAVRELQTRSAIDPTSWTYQAAIHGSATTPAQKGWNQCQHGGWYFLPWHRLYLYYLERLVRSVVLARGGPADWALPYWNYDGGGTTNTLPLPFRSPTLPDGSPNPLFVATRNPAVNAGAGLPPQATSAATAMAATTYAPPPFPGFGGGQTDGPEHFFNAPGALEQTPHNVVHVLLGGLMRDPNTAALDPVFWLHHCNVDRLWMEWNAAGNANPAVSAWVDQTFELFDETGAPTTRRLADAADPVGALGYRYDTVSPGVPMEGFGEMTEPTPVPSEPEMVGAAASPVSLTGGSASVEVPLDPRAARNLTTVGGGRLYLSLEHVDADTTPEQAYTVSIESTGKDAARYPVGSLALFGIEKLHEARGEDGPHHQRLLYDITDVADRLGGEQALGTLRVVFEEMTLQAPGATGFEPAPEPRDVVPIRVGRVTLRRG